MDINDLDFASLQPCVVVAIHELDVFVHVSPPVNVCFVPSTHSLL